jgi:lipoprotein-anchoring transpeptidase ErfK/SrfK
MKKTIFLISIFAVLTLQSAYSQAKENIFDALETPDATTGAKVTFVQDDKIETMLLQKNATTIKGGTVYRIQVFSSNQRTAKSEATGIEKQLRNSFPTVNVQVNYASPFWKVRIGEFSSREEANKFRLEVMAAMPSQKNQIYVVAERNK